MTLGVPFGYDGKSYSGKEFRQLVAALYPISGVVPNAAGVAGYAVTAQGSPNTTVAVAAGNAIVAATAAGEFGSYEIGNDASVNSPAFTATTTNPRWDYVILRITAGVAAIQIVQGTASGTPAAPTITGDNFIPLALVKLPASTTNITGTMVNDVRPIAAVSSGVPVGSVEAFGGPESSLPSGWLLCNGAAVSRTLYARLFAVITTWHGAGDGSTTFNVPDLRGRTPVAPDAMGGVAAGVLTSASGFATGRGEETHLLLAAESGMPNHTHPLARQAFLVVGGGIGLFGLPTTTTDNSGVTNGSGDFNAVSRHNNMQPSLFLNYLIKT